MIIRSPRPDSNFYILDKRISEDRLSWEARGLLIFLLGKPDHWKVSVDALRAETAGTRKQTGRDGIYAILDELIEAGYVVRERVVSNGRVVEWTYHVREEPLPAKTDVAPDPAQPDLARPDQEKPDALVSIEEKQELREARSAKRLPSASQPDVPSGDAVTSSEKKKSAARGTRLAEETLPAEWGAWARKERPDLDVLLVWDLFADYWRAKPGKDGVKCDWFATWKNWIRRERVQFAGRSTKSDDFYSNLMAGAE